LKFNQNGIAICKDSNEKYLLENNRLKTI